MGIPSAHNLFHQMISESGGAERVWPTRSAAAEVSQGFAAAYTSATGQTAASLKTAGANSLIPIQKEFIEVWPKHFPLRAEVDGKLLPRLPIETIAAGSTKAKRLLIGTNRDESALFLGPDPKHDPTALDLGNLPLPQFTEIYAQYKSIYPDMTDIQRRIRAVTAEEYWIPSLRVAEAHTRTGGSTFMYRLDFTESSGRLSGYAYHSLDVGMVWDKPHAAVENAVAEAALASQMHTAWAAFIRGEAPSSPGLPTWPEYNLGQRSTMILNTDSKVAILPQNAELRLWENKL